MRCGHCGNEFIPNPRYKKKSAPQIYCSRQCAWNANYIRWNERIRNSRSPAYLKRLALFKAYRQKRISEGGCSRCGRENDRKSIGLRTCSGCAEYVATRG